MTQQLLSLDLPPVPPGIIHRAERHPALTSVVEFAVCQLRETPIPSALSVVDDPASAQTYCKAHLQTSPMWRPNVENFSLIFLNTRRRAIGHAVISHGTLDTLLVHSRDVFHMAITLCASAIVMIHNHPSGDPTPSESDIRVTRDLIRAGQILKIDVLDHIVLGRPGGSSSECRGYTSLRELGHFFY